MNRYWIIILFFIFLMGCVVRAPLTGDPNGELVKLRQESAEGNRSDSENQRDFENAKREKKEQTGSSFDNFYKRQR